MAIGLRLGIATPGAYVLLVLMPGVQGTDLSRLCSGF